MRILKKLLLLLIVVVIALLAIAYLLPREVSVSRSVDINASAADVFPHVNSVKGHEAWSPWLDRDPNIVLTYNDIASGVGSQMSWVSDQPDVGVGAQEITASIENQRVESILDFGDMGTAKAFFELAENGGVTNVTWGFTSDAGMNPVMRWFGLMMDSFVGPDYELGLSRLKALVEE